MKELATITYSDESGKPAAVCAGDILRVEHLADGSVLVLRNGERLSTKSTVAVIQAAIDALWDAFLVALTGV